MISINHNEAVIDELWDPDISQLDKYTVDSHPSRGLTLKQNWCWSEGSWKQSQEKRIGKLSRILSLKTDSYRYLIVCASIPDYVRMRVLVYAADGKEIRVVEKHGKNSFLEYIGSIDGCNHIHRLTIEFFSESESPGIFLLLWIGLSKIRYSSEIKPFVSAEKDWDQKFFDKYIVTEKSGIELAPQFEFLIRKHDLHGLREAIVLPRFKGIYKQLESLAEAYITYDPRLFLKEGVYFTGRAPDFARERDRLTTDIRSICLTLSFVGLMKNDYRMARKACEMALTLSSCREWRESFIAAYPFSQWRHASFSEALCAETLCIVLDWSGQVLNRQGLGFISESIYEKALHQIDRQFFKSGYYWDVNPAMVFLIPGILGSLIVSDHWPRYQNRARQFYKRFMQIFHRAIFRDGGCRVSPGYWNKKAVPPVYGFLIANGFSSSKGDRFYRRLIDAGKKINPTAAAAFDRVFGSAAKFFISKYYKHHYFPGTSRLLKAFQRYAKYVEALLSTAGDSPRLIPVGDSTTSSVLPEGVFMLAKIARGKTKRFWSDLAGIFFDDENDTAITSPMRSIQALLAAPPEIRTPPAPQEDSRSIFLPDSCFFSSMRIHNGKRSKFLIVGLPKHSDHRHHEAGTFVLEIDGEELFIDRGSLNYSHPLGNLIKETCYHNGLTPEDPFGRWATQDMDNTAPVRIKIVRRTASSFRCLMHLNSVWKKYFQNYQREIESRTPDDYLLKDRLIAWEPTAVACHLQTPLPCRINGNAVEIEGKRFMARLTPCVQYINRSYSVDLIDYRLLKINHIVFTTGKSRSHNLSVHIKIS